MCFIKISTYCLQMIPSLVAKRVSITAYTKSGFVCVTSYTATCEIPGITVAGANLESLKYTSPADAEFLHYGHCKCIDRVPVTLRWQTLTPAIIITRAAKIVKYPIFRSRRGVKNKTFYTSHFIRHTIWKEYSIRKCIRYR